jgi:hypothetical protein
VAVLVPHTFRIHSLSYPLFEAKLWAWILSTSASIGLLSGTLSWGRAPIVLQIQWHCQCIKRRTFSYHKHFYKHDRRLQEFFVLQSTSRT